MGLLAFSFYLKPSFGRQGPKVRTCTMTVLCATRKEKRKLYIYIYNTYTFYIHLYMYKCFTQSTALVFISPIPRKSCSKYVVLLHKLCKSNINCCQCISPPEVLF